MRFETPSPKSIAFEIPDDWWFFSEMNNFVGRADHLHYLHEHSDAIRFVPIQEIEPPWRCEGVEVLQKHRLASLFLAFTSPDPVPLPPVQLKRIEKHSSYRFRIYNGCHRCYASVAAGFSELPVIVVPDEL